jgi:hypothetical protein
VALLVAGGWWALQPTSVDDAGQLTTSVPVAVSYASDLAAAREQFRNGDLAGAVRRALAIPAGAPESSDATLLLREIRSEAQARSQTARLGAERSGQTSNASFADAVGRDEAAAKLTRPEDLERVVLLYEEAAALYRKAATARASIAELLQLARAEVKANNMQSAIAYALQVLETDARNREALGLLRTTREQGRKLAQAAAADARRAGVSADNSAGFKEAIAQEAAAAQMTTPQQTLRAYEGFLSAAQRYRDAGERFTAETTRRLADARSAREQAEQRLQSGDLDGAAAAIQQAERLEPNAQSIAPLRKRLADARASKNAAASSAEIDQALAGVTKVTDDPEALKMLADLAARYPNDSRIDAALRTRRQTRDNRVAELLRRAQSSPDAQALELLEDALRLDPSRQDVLGERNRRRAAVNVARTESDLRNVVTQLEAAYERGDAAEVVRLAPVMDRARLEAQFKAFRISWDVEPCAVRIDSTGRTANLTCIIYETAQPAGVRARVAPVTQTRHFVMTNVDGAWRITAQQIQ